MSQLVPWPVSLGFFGRSYHHCWLWSYSHTQFLPLLKISTQIDVNNHITMIAWLTISSNPYYKLTPQNQVGYLIKQSKKGTFFLLPQINTPQSTRNRNLWGLLIQSETSYACIQCGRMRLGLGKYSRSPQTISSFHGKCLSRVDSQWRDKLQTLLMEMWGDCLLKCPANHNSVSVPNSLLLFPPFQ